MMGQNLYHLIVAASLISLVAVGTAQASDTSDLNRLVHGNEDVRITAYDLAFLLATHGYDATPSGDHILVRLDGKTYVLTPNGDAPGLASIT